METNELKRKIKALDLPGILEIQPFGRQDLLTLWVEAKSIQVVASRLASDPNLKLSWLENMSAMELNQALVVSYFVRSMDSPTKLVLRVSLTPKGPEEEVQLDSVIRIWSMAKSFEREISDLFGIRFTGNAMPGRYLLPEDWIGFPLRKSYVFPTSFFGISHFRPVGHSIPDEHASDFGADGADLTPNLSGVEP